MKGSAGLCVLAAIQGRPGERSELEAGGFFGPSKQATVALIWQKINPLLSNAPHQSERLGAARFKF